MQSGLRISVYIPFRERETERETDRQTQREQSKIQIRELPVLLKGDTKSSGSEWFAVEYMDHLYKTNVPCLTYAH